MNDLRLDDVVALYELANVTCDINDGMIVRMMIEGGNDNE